jgi:hypothetical protein
MPDDRAEGSSTFAGKAGGIRQRTASDFDVFISYNFQDRAQARDLKVKLEKRQLSVWLAEDELQPGRPWQPLIEMGLERSGSVIVALGPAGIGDWQSQESQLALNQASHAQRPIIPVFLPGFTNQDALKGFLSNNTWVDLRNGYPAEQIDRLVWGITGEKQFAYKTDRVSAPPIGTKWILVAGSGGITPRPSSIDDISKRLGDALASARFSLVTGGWGGVDHIVARAFCERLQQMGQALSGRLVQVMAEGETPHFPSGRLVSEGTDDEAWRRSIERANAVILVGGVGGTLTTGRWAVQTGRPVFPIADSRGPAGTHGDAYKFYFRTLREWPRNPISKFLTKEQFEELGNPAPGVVKDLTRLLLSAFRVD